MGLVQCLVVVLMLPAQLVLTSPTEPTKYYTLQGRRCRWCPAGEYQSSCTECLPCPAGTFTTESNREESCHPCYTDCKTNYHQKVVQNCTRESDLKCICEAGFTCTAMVPLSENCRDCEKIKETTTTEAATIISDNDKHTVSSASSASSTSSTSSAPSGHSSTSAKPCQFPKCAVSVSEAGHIKTDSSQLAAILCPVVSIGFVALIILFFVRRPRNESCFKQVIALLLCNEGGRDASHKSKESTHQFPRDSFSTKQQPSSLSAANLGPVHVHNPGTVIFSLLSQFTGQVGPTIEGGKTVETKSGEEDERDCPVFHPTSSPSIHLSEEERRGETESIFFPSQEQGKDCHVSKEESL
ncbi:tumor necrosis factor receptor superfamily member 5 [Dicentrarchus labrax]|uniref:tumor necrosis factor receptor superfamily member 5 n=1 Tax=Dicentrarchus labrax TaxID=13489 RepID=UPI0021F69A00|nr:tumor necrosis factor receptor superfamily member 5 [Dicentrarchus labrax]